jgi:hypothetical protein
MRNNRKAYRPSLQAANAAISSSQSKKVSNTIRKATEQ